MIRIAVQTKGRLNEDSLSLLREAGISIEDSKRKLLTKSEDFPVEVLYLRDDDIPQAVNMGVADAGIVGLNEVEEKNFTVDLVHRLGFGKCRISLAVPKNVEYTGLDYFNGKRIATSYPVILSRFFAEKQIDAEIHEIAGSVEIAPGIGLADAIFDIVSSGSTLVSNRLKEVEIVMESEAVLIANPWLSTEKKEILEELLFRINAVQIAEDKKYILMNVPTDNLEQVLSVLPGMKSPTIMPLATPGWSSVHTVLEEKRFWEIINKLKSAGAEGILVLNIEKMVL